MGLVFLHLLVPQGTGREPLPRGWKDLLLGISLEDAKNNLKANADFRYRGDPDVTFLLQPNTNLIETEGSYFFSRAALQFAGEKLFILTLDLRQDRIDYFSLFSAFSKKYGDPNRLDPKGAFWENGDTMFSLEKPLTVKYTDLKKLEELRSAARVQGTIQELTREQFLEQF